MNELTIEVEKREQTGKNVNRRLRSAGLLPAVVYGGGKESVPIQVGRKKVEELLRASGDNAIFLLQLEGTGSQRHTMIREVQTDPVSGRMLHIDFQRIDLKKKVQVSVPIELEGKAVGVRTEEGILDFVTREIEVECLPDKIPAKIVLDVTDLHVNQHVEAGQLELPEGVTLEEEPDRVIVSVGHARLPEVVEEEEAEALLEEEAEEPEVIQRGKAAEEEEEGEEDEG